MKHHEVINVETEFFEYEFDSYNDLDEIALYASEEHENLRMSQERVRHNVQAQSETDPLWGIFA
jgi:hypothetical protein